MNCRLRDVEETHRDENGVITRSVSFEAALVFFLLRQVGRVKKNCKQIQRDGPGGQHQEFVERPVDFSIPPKCYPPLQNQQQQGRDGKDNVDLIERVFFASVKRAPSSREQIGHAETDDYRHQCRNEFETAHQVWFCMARERNAGQLRKSSGKWLYLGSARVSRAGERVLAIADFTYDARQMPWRCIRKDCCGGTPQPARGTHALPGRRCGAWAELVFNNQPTALFKSACAAPSIGSL